jgi:YebC/PmpR family DNA-binding regulatory protein
MSGHSKWSQIKHRKAITDAKKSQIFGKMANLISLAAEQGGKDPNTNSKLKMAIDKAKSINMPSSNIERAIKRGAGKGEENNLEELLIEAFGPYGLAILIKAVTDNRNRTISEIKHILNKNNGKMAGSGSVSWMFKEKGKIILNKEKLNEEEELKIIELGVEDIKEEDDKIVLITNPEKLFEIKNKIKELDIDILESELVFIPNNLEEISEEKKEIYRKLFEIIDNHPDVNDIFFNFGV